MNQLTSPLFLMYRSSSGTQREVECFAEHGLDNLKSYSETIPNAIEPSSNSQPHLIMYVCVYVCIYACDTNLKR